MVLRQKMCIFAVSYFYRYETDMYDTVGVSRHDDDGCQGRAGEADCQTGECDHLHGRRTGEKNQDRGLEGW